MPNILTSVYALRKPLTLKCPHCQAAITVHPRLILAVRLGFLGMLLAGVLTKLGDSTSLALAPYVAGAAIVGFLFAWFAGRYHVVD